jgi:DNA-binding transcriptional LysR family regulator
LFRRVRQRLVLTSAGASYAPAVRAGLTRIGGATERLLLDRRTGLSLVVAVGSTFGARWLVPRLNEFREKSPDITPHLVTFSIGPVPYDFAREQVDAAIYFGEEPWANATCHRLCGEECIPVCSPQLLGNGIRSAGDLTRFTLLHLQSRPTAWTDWMAKAGFGLDGALRGPMFQTMAMMGEAAVVGVGVALMPRFLIADDLASGRLAIASPISVTSPGSYFLAYPQRTINRVPALEAFRDWLVEHPQLSAMARPSEA